MAITLVGTKEGNVWEVHFNKNSSRIWIASFETKEDAMLADRICIENYRLFTNSETFRLIVSDKMKARKIFKNEKIEDGVSGLLEDTREFLPLMVNFKGKIQPFGYIHRKDIDDAVGIIKSNSSLEVRDISMILSKTVRKVPKNQSTRVSLRNKKLSTKGAVHIAYVDNYDLNRWKLFLEEKKNNMVSLDLLKEEFKKTFQVIDIKKEEVKVNKEDLLDQLCSLKKLVEQLTITVEKS